MTPATINTMEDAAHRFYDEADAQAMSIIQTLDLSSGHASAYASIAFALKRAYHRGSADALDGVRAILGDMVKG